MSIPYDKCLHVIVGVIIFAILQLINVPMALVVVILVALGKEAYDYFHPRHTCDIWDAVATICGGILGFICTL